MNTKLHDTVNILTFFVRSFGFRQGVCLLPSEVVRVVRRAQEVWLTTPPGSKRTTKMWKTVKSENKNMKNKANFKSIKFTTTPCNIGGYSDLHPETQNGTKPNKANLRQSRRSLGEDGNPILARRPVGVVIFTNTTKHSLLLGEPSFLEQLFLESKPNFPNPRPILTRETERAYNNLRPQNHKKSKPKANPIQTQFSASCFLWFC